ELDLQRAAGAQPSLAGALVARADDDLAEALAGGARPAGHHLTEEGALHLLDLALTATGLAGAPAGARLAAVAGAVGADRGGVDRQVLLAAEAGRVEADLQPAEPVLAAGAPRAGTAAAPTGTGGAEELLHDVAEGEAGAEAVLGAAVGVGAHVVLATLGLVTEHVVGLADLLEALLRLGARVDVRVQRAGQLAVGPLDVLLARVV